MDDSGSTRRHVEELLLRHRSVDGVVGALEGLCRAMAEELALVGAVVTLMPGVGAHAISASSSAAARKVEEAQFGVGEGPTRDAFRARRPVLVAELEAAEGGAPVAGDGVRRPGSSVRLGRHPVVQLLPGVCWARDRGPED